MVLKTQKRQGYPGGKPLENKHVEYRTLSTVEEDRSEYRGENNLSYLVTDYSPPKKKKKIKKCFMFE